MELKIFSQLLAYIKPYLFNNNNDKLIRLSNKVNVLMNLKEGFKIINKEEKNEVTKALFNYNLNTDEKIMFDASVAAIRKDIDKLK